MNDTLAMDWIALTLPAVAACFFLIAAFGLVSLIRLNKGAKVNRAWGLIAFGLACLAIAALDRTLELLGLPNASSLRDGLSAGASLFIMIGAVYARGLYRGLLK